MPAHSGVSATGRQGQEIILDLGAVGKIAEVHIPLKLLTTALTYESNAALWMEDAGGQATIM